MNSIITCQDPSMHICNNELDSWFNELDEKTIEIINNNLMKEEEESDNDILLDNKHNHVSIDKDNKNELALSDDEVTDITVKYINVDEIIAKCPESLSSNDLIHNVCSIAYFVQVLMEGSANNKFKSLKTFNTDLSLEKIKSIIDYLRWISTISETLAKRIGQEIMCYKNEGIPVIIRSSYNFCTKYTQCKNFYSIRETPVCREHHYVHSLLKYDVDSVIMFLEYIVKNTITMTNEELNNLYLSIKTICFVARHMGKEISYIDHVTKNNSEKFHRNNPIEIISKKKGVTTTRRQGYVERETSLNSNLNTTKKIWNDNDRPSKIDRNDRSDRNDRNDRNDRHDRLQTESSNENYNRSNSKHYPNRNYDRHKENTNRSFYPPKTTNNTSGFRKNPVSFNKPVDTLTNRFSLLSDF